MLLSDKSIRDALCSGRIHISPFEERLLRPCSICLTLGDKIIRLTASDGVDIRDSSTYPKALDNWDLDDKDYYLEPGEFVLAITEQTISLDNTLAGLLCNISGLARLGIELFTPALVSPGYGSSNPSAITIEIANKGLSPISLIHGMRICHLSFINLDVPSEGNYDKDVGIYSNQKSPELSAFFRNWD